MPPNPSFEQAFSNLIDHLRTRPDGGAEAQVLLHALREEVTRDGVVAEAGVELEGTPHDPGLLGCMHRRRVETITVQHDAPADELLQLAGALAADNRPIPVTDKVHVSFVVDITPGEKTDRSPAPPSTSPRPGSVVEDTEIPLVMGFDQDEDRAPRLPEGFADELQDLASAIRESERRGSWTEALHAAQALTHLTGRTPSDGRRRMAIAGRRMVSRSLMRAFIDHAIRVPEERPRVVQVLEWVGRDAAELVIDALSETESIGPKVFLCDLAARLPDAYPLVDALLRSPDWYQVRLGADLLGRRGKPDGVGALAAQCDHGDPRVRRTVMAALGSIDATTTGEPLVRGLADPDVSVRVVAAAALGGRSARGVTMALAQALEREQDPTARTAMIEALGAICSDEAATVLSTVATTGRTLFRRRGYTVEQRLAAVAALAGCQARGAARALERVATTARGRVPEAARRALESHISEAQRNQAAAR